MPAPRGKLPEVWPSGQRQQTVNLSGKALRWFESIRLHHLPGLGGARGSNSGVESQPPAVGRGFEPSPAPRRRSAACSGRRDSAFGAVSRARAREMCVSASESRLPCAPCKRWPASGRRRSSSAAYGGNVRCQALGAPAFWQAAAEAATISAPAEGRHSFPTPPPPPPSLPPRSTATGTPAPSPRPTSRLAAGRVAAPCPGHGRRPGPCRDRCP